MMSLDLFVDLFGLLDPALRRFHPARFEFPQAAGDPLGPAFQNPRLVLMTDGRFLHGRIRREGLEIGEIQLPGGVDNQGVERRFALGA